MAEGCRYDDAGPWTGAPQPPGAGFLPGAQALGEFLVATYGGTFQGFSWRPNTADPRRLSVHGTGRAVDWFPPNMTVGHLGAYHAAEMHEEWGIQLVIWDHRDWSCSELDDPHAGFGPGWTDYGGPNPHTDHAHLELTIPAAEHNTATTYGSEEDLSIMEPETKSYLDEKFRLGRDRDRTILTYLRAVRKGQGVADDDLTDIDEQLDRIEREVKAEV